MMLHYYFDPDILSHRLSRSNFKVFRFVLKKSDLRYSRVSFQLTKVKNNYELNLVKHLYENINQLVKIQGL